MASILLASIDLATRQGVVACHGRNKKENQKTDQNNKKVRNSVSDDESE
jgi:hypothetical protein